MLERVFSSKPYQEHMHGARAYRQTQPAQNAICNAGMHCRPRVLGMSASGVQIVGAAPQASLQTVPEASVTPTMGDASVAAAAAVRLQLLQVVW